MKAIPYPTRTSTTAKKRWYQYHVANPLPAPALLERTTMMVLGIPNTYALPARFLQPSPRWLSFAC
ncbi:MAG: hypothetical protein NVS4B8_22230 [Herpetosiphon sp.]